MIFLGIYMFSYFEIKFGNEGDFIFIILICERRFYLKVVFLREEKEKVFFYFSRM